MDLDSHRSFSNLAYWLEFWRGHLTAKRDGRVTPDNPYVRFVRHLRSNGIVFEQDPTTATTDATVFTRCEARLKLFDLDEHDPIVLFDCSPSASSFEAVEMGKRRRLRYTSCDGSHRLAVALFRGIDTVCAYHFQVFDRMPSS